MVFHNSFRISKKLSGVSGWFTEMWDRLIASDPGLTRLQMAISGAVGVASVMFVEFGFALLTRAGQMGMIISIMLGAVVTMMGMMALNGPRIWPKIRTAAFFPVAVGIGLLCGVIVSGNTDLMLVVFVAIMFAAVVVRQYGIPFFFYGFMGWMGFFFATFTHATLDMIPKFLAAILVASVWVVLLSSTLMRTNPQKNLHRTLIAIDSCARTMIRDCANLLLAADDKQRKKIMRKLRANQARVAEAALMAEGWTSEPDALPFENSGPTLRRLLIDMQHVLNAMASAVNVLVESDDTVVHYTARIAECLVRRSDHGIKMDVQNLNHCVSNADYDDHICLAVRQFSEAILEFVRLAEQMTAGKKDWEWNQKDVDEFEPVVGLFLGNLPGSPAVAGDVSARGVRWNPLARLSLVNRQAFQVAVAGGLAIYFGRELSTVRYYWAVIAAFVMFTGTATRSETLIKGLNRVLGTLAGLLVAIWLANLTAGHIGWVLFTIVACIFCGFYLLRLSYAYMIFFITIMIGQLYSVMHMFSPELLLLRLEETAVGACVGIAVSLIFVPLSTRDTIRTARNNLLIGLSELLDASADKLSNPNEPLNLDALTMSLDNWARQLTLVAKPLNTVVMRRQNSRVRHRLALYTAISNEARSLTVALRTLNPACANELTSICRSLARSVAELADHSSDSSRTIVKDELASVEKSLFGLSLSPSELATNPVCSEVLQLQRLVKDLFENPVDPL